MVGFALRGAGRVTIGVTTHVVGRYDGWNHPSWRPYQYVNDGDEPFVWLTYSNAPLLERMNVHLVEDLAAMPSGEPVTTSAEPVDEAADARRHSPFGTFELADGAYLMPYETLIDPPSLPSPALHWPWADVKEHLDRLEALGDSYVGRRLYLMYNPLTGRTNGTTPSFFATITIRPPAIVDRPHRHVSAAINYFFHGSGWSRVGGQRYEWTAGDLMLTAPGWMIHHHASDPDDRVYELTVQDQPLNIAMESLLWQEDLKRPARVLGSAVRFRHEPDGAVITLQPATLCGSLPPLVTPFRDGAVDYDTYARLVDWQVAEGSHGVVTCGTSGEPSVLTVAERKQLTEVAIDAAAGRITVIAATGSQSHAETVELTEHAAAKPAPTRCSSSRRTTSARLGAASSSTSSTSPGAATCRSCCTTSPDGRRWASTSACCTTSPSGPTTSSG